MYGSTYRLVFCHGTDRAPIFPPNTTPSLPSKYCCNRDGIVRVYQCYNHERLSFRDRDEDQQQTCSQHNVIKDYNEESLYI